MKNTFKNKVTNFLDTIKTSKARIILFIILCLIVTKACTTVTYLSVNYLLASPISTVTMLTPYSILMFCVHLGFWTCFLLLCARSRIIAYTLLPLIIISQAAINFAVFTYGVENKEMVIAVLNATTAEAGLYSSDVLMSRLPFVLIAAFGIAYLVRKLLSFPISKKVHYLLISMGFIGSITFLTLPQLIKKQWIEGAMACIEYYDTMHPEYRTWPIHRSKESVLKEAVLIGDEYDRCYQPLNVVIDACVSLYDFYNPPALKKAEEEPSEIVWENLPQTVVLYIGESTRADHCALNGYNRSTMPGIEKENNIINFPNVHCLKTHTIASIYQFLVLNNPKYKEPTHNSFLGILKKHGYNLDLLVGANTEGMWYNTPTIAPLLSGNVTLHSRPKSAEEYACAMHQIQQKHSNNFIMIEDGAGHAPFISESIIKPFGEDTKIDCYDNAIIDIDRRLCAIIETMRDKDALLFFTADHGESLGENNRWGHGGPTTIQEQTHVCSFIWYSDSYASNHPEIIEKLKKNAQGFTSHAQLYHTIISICGIKSSVQIDDLDLTKDTDNKN
ncbi:MAG: sulfatase-like hydrolase/transferase [Akkermansia sp.]|nr:sulfatase-like hydrolase/transferase [Akkermansia sp.]